MFEKIKLMHNDRVIFGTNSTFLVKFPGKQARDPGLPEDIDFEFA